MPWVGGRDVSYRGTTSPLAGSRSITTKLSSGGLVETQ
jgi:hypothetical protein